MLTGVSCGNILTTQLSLIVEFQGKHLTRDSGVVNVLMEMLRKATLFQNLGYTTEVTQGEGPVAIQVSLTDTLFQNASFADLVRFPDEQAKLNRLAFRTLNEIEVKLKTDYYTGDVGARTFVGDLNYLVVTLHAHLEETFPLVFALSARRTYAAAADAAVPQVAKVFAKSPETSVMTEREVLAGVLKAAVQGPSVLGGIRATSSGRLRRMLRDVSRARAEGELPDLEWFKLA